MQTTHTPKAGERTQSSIINAYLFFKRHAGYCVGRRSAGALKLARAEQMAREAGVEIVWESDDYADFSFVKTWPEGEQKKFWSTEHFAESCMLRSSDGEALASCGGIIDADRNYRRVMEAELALEAQGSFLSYSI